MPIVLSFYCFSFQVLSGSICCILYPKTRNGLKTIIIMSKQDTYNVTEKKQKNQLDT